MRERSLLDPFARQYEGRADQFSVLLCLPKLKLVVEISKNGITLATPANLCRESHREKEIGS